MVNWTEDELESMAKSEDLKGLGLLGSLFIFSVIDLRLRGKPAHAGKAAFNAAGFACLSGISLLLLKSGRTRQKPQPNAAGQRATALVCLSIIFATGFASAANLAGDRSNSEFPRRLSPSWPPRGVPQFLLYVAVPTILLRPPIGPFQQADTDATTNWRLAAVWLSLPLTLIAIRIAMRRISLPHVFLTILDNAISNGYSEEFFWRRLVLNALRQEMSPKNAVGFQALIFGLWHFPMNLRNSDGNARSALEASIVFQGVFGYAMGWLVVETNDIVLASAFHTAFNTALFAWL